MSSHEDSDFWNQVLLRFSACKFELAQVIIERAQLANELRQVQEERDKLCQELEKGQVSAAESTRPTTVQHRGHESIDARKLQELEVGIAHAQESYQNIERRLKDNELMIQDLRSSNQSLRSDRNLMELCLNECRDALKGVEAKLQQTHSENELLRDRLRSWVREPVARAETKQPLTPSENGLRLEIERVYKPRIASLEREAEDLRSSNRKLKDDQKRFEEELEATRAKLNKLKVSKSTLQDQLKGLGELTRRESLRSHITTGSHVVPPSPRSTLSSLNPSNASGNPNFVSSRPSAATMDEKTAVDIISANDQIGDEDNAPTPRPAFPPVSIPRYRQQELTGFLVVDSSVSVGAENAFSREFMTTVLGGSIRPLIVRNSKHKNASKKNVTSYLCPSLDHNPWCPTTPGQNGYIFVGLGREKETFIEPEEREVFVGLKKTSKESVRRFKYLGRYRTVRVHSLTLGEWSSLSQQVKARYAKAMQEKEKDTRMVEEILKAYDDGELTVPCVQLQCIDFDKELYKTLVSESAKRKKAKSSSSSSHKRALDYEADEDCARKRRTVKRAQ